MKALLRSEGLSFVKDPASRIAHFELRTRFSLVPAEGESVDMDAVGRTLEGRSRSVFREWAESQGVDIDGSDANELAVLED